eukprot:Em0005g1204a
MAERHVEDLAHSDANLKETKKKKLRINVKFWYYMEATTLVILAAFVWGMFSLPAVFYWGQQAVDKAVSLCGKVTRRRTLLSSRRSYQINGPK